MDNYPNQSPVDREININSSSVLMCKINAKGIIEYVNPSFSETCGYQEYEIIGESLDILHHPDVPQVIYNVLKERLQNNESVRLIIKQLAKDGRYYWVLSDFETKTDESGNLIAHYSHSVAAPTYAVHKINSLYKILTKIESKTKNTDVSKRYLIGFLEERSLNYNQFIEELSVYRHEYEKPFQKQQIHQEQNNQDRNINSHLNNMSYSSSFDISNADKTKIPNQKKPLAKKKKSLFKRVFGK